MTLSKNTKTRVAIVHEWLTGMRGGEKCVEALCEVFSDATLFTLVHVKGSVSQTIERMPIRTSFIQHLPFAEKRYRQWKKFSTPKNALCIVFCVSLQLIQNVPYLKKHSKRSNLRRIKKRVHKPRTKKGRAGSPSRTYPGSLFNLSGRYVLISVIVPEISLSCRLFFITAPVILQGSISPDPGVCMSVLRAAFMLALSLSALVLSSGRIKIPNLWIIFEIWLTAIIYIV